MFLKAPPSPVEERKTVSMHGLSLPWGFKCTDAWSQNLQRKHMIFGLEEDQVTCIITLLFVCGYWLYCLYKRWLTWPRKTVGINSRTPHGWQEIARLLLITLNRNIIDKRIISLLCANTVGCLKGGGKYLPNQMLLSFPVLGRFRGKTDGWNVRQTTQTVCCKHPCLINNKYLKLRNSVNLLLLE